jgi:hypothetical protein
MYFVAWKLTAVAALAGLNRDNFSADFVSQQSQLQIAKPYLGIIAPWMAIPKQYAEEEGDYSLQIIQQSLRSRRFERERRV